MMNETKKTQAIYFIIIFLAAGLMYFKHVGSYRVKSSFEITENELMEHIRYLAHENRQGRYPGTRESKDVISYMVRQLKSYGVKPGFENNSYAQPFSITDGIELGGNNQCVVNQDTLAVSSDFIPVWFSGNTSVTAPVVFAGYGFNIDEDQLLWNDYDELDVSGKWVMVMRHGPERNNQHSSYGPHTGLHKKMLVARDKGAVGIIFVSQKEDKELYPLKFISGYKNAGIPAIHLSNEKADQLLSQFRWNRESIQNIMDSDKASVQFDMPNVSISATVDLNLIEKRAANVVGIIRSGNRQYRDEYVVIGAHFDHLGWGGPGTGSRAPDTLAIHPGADDNASGTAGLLEIAQKLTSKKSHLKRSVILIGFDAEEKGLLGAKFFVDHPPVPLENLTAMLNMDMIGHMADSSSNVGGVGTSPIFEPMLDSLSQNRPFTINMTKPGYGPSDHAAFYGKDIPVLFFFSGVHSDYHKPSDTWDLINLGGEKAIVDLVYDVAYHLARLDERPAFTEAGPKQGRARKNTKFKVTFGIVPAYGSTKEGLEVDGLSKADGPAAKAGIKKGDLITSMNGKSVKDIYEFMDRLGELKPGMTIPVMIDRRGEKMELSVSF